MDDLGQGQQIICVSSDELLENIHTSVHSQALQVDARYYSVIQRLGQLPKDMIRLLFHGTMCPDKQESALDLHILQDVL